MAETKRNLDWCRQRLGETGKTMTDAQVIHHRDLIEYIINSIFNEVLYGKESA